MQKCVWQVEFIVEPQLRQSETIGEFEFEVRESGETIVKRTYETSAFDQHHSKRRHAYEYAEETLVRLDAEAIRTILLKRMLYQRLVSPINIRLVTSPTLVNREQLRADGVHLRRSIGASFDINSPMLDVENCLADSETFWMLGFKGIARGQEDEVLRVAEWLERSARETDGVKGFILCWIGFNGLYSLIASLNGKRCSPDADKFEFAIDHFVSPSQAQDIIRSIGTEITKFEGYDIRSGNTNWSRKLSAERGKPVINNVAILKLVTRCIYGVRKQVFHEAPRTIDVLERATGSNTALMQITLMCLKSFVTH